MKKLILWLLIALLILFIGLFIYAIIKDQQAKKPPIPPKPPITEVKKIGRLLYRAGERPLAIANADYTTSDGQKKTNNKGEFEYQNDEEITFKLATLSFTLPAKAEISVRNLVSEPSQQHNIATLLANIDEDNQLETGIQLGDIASKINAIDINKAEDDFIQALYLQLNKYPKLSFIPSLGINLESPQAKADTVGQAMPFVDIFRTARPFQELSPKGIQYDKHGWPIKIPVKSFARTKLLQGTLQNAIPNGEYTVFYDGTGKLSFGSDALKTFTQVNKGIIKLDIQTKDASDYTEANSLSVVINYSKASDPIRNIRIIMPGGICRDKEQAIDAKIDPVQSNDNPFLRVTNSNQCPETTKFVSFAELYKANRNLIVFNPEYLKHLRNFRVIRMMNFMESSPSYKCRNLKKEEYTACLDEGIAWNDRATMDDSVWGGSSRTAFLQHKGVPIEVLTALANQLNRDPWFVLPHYVDDEYVEQFATYIQQHLNKTLHPHIEYSNETWNPGFQSHYYVKQKGMDEGLDKIPKSKHSFRSNRDGSYFASLNYYVKRSLEIFDIWNNVFADDKQRLVKILSGQQGDTILSEEMLKYNNASQKIDALAIGSYFYGCIDRKSARCAITPSVLSNVESTDDIFDIIDHGKGRLGGDPSALEGTLDKLERQAKVAQEYGVQLMTYEGGQHLTIMGSMGNADQDRKNALRKLFRDANRDPRMRERYIRLLSRWKELHKQYSSVSLFTLYTMAQSYYDYGSWGLKEWLDQEREEAPKFDAAMTFQEEVVTPWWQENKSTPTP